MLLHWCVHLRVVRSMWQRHLVGNFPSLCEGMGADFVFPFFIVNELPVGLTGLLIASIFAAGMSTVATSVTSSSTIFLTDYYLHFRKQASNREKLVVLKSASVMVGVLGALVAFAFMNAESALDAWWALSSIFSGGMLGLFLLGYLSKKARNIDAPDDFFDGFSSGDTVKLKGYDRDGLSKFSWIRASQISLVAEGDVSNIPDDILEEFNNHKW